MTERDFCYWLQGFFEVAKPETLTSEQIQEIHNHLKLVFTKVTPELTTLGGGTIQPVYVGPFNPNKVLVEC